MYANRGNSRVLWEIEVEEHDDDVIFSPGSASVAVSRMHNEKKRNITLIYGRIA